MAKIIGHDQDGNPIDESGNVATPSAPEKPYTADTFMDNLGKQLSPYIPTITSMGGATAGAELGTAVGGPIGGLVGAPLGSIISYLLAKKATGALNNPGKPVPGLNGEDVKDAAYNELFNTGIPHAVQGAGKVASFLGDSPLLRSILKMAPHQQIPADTEAILNTPNLDRSMGDVTGSAKLKSMETRQGKDALVDLRNTQKKQQVDEINNLFQKIGGQGNPPSTAPAPQPDLTATVGRQGQQALADAYNSSKGKYEGLYNQFQKQVIEPNTHNIKVVTGYGPDTPSSIIDPSTGQPGPPTPGGPIVEDRQVELPTFLNRTAQYAKDSLPKLNQYIGPDAYENLPPTVQSKYKRISKLLEDISTPTQVMTDSGDIVETPIKNYDAVKQTRTDLQSLIDNSTGIKKKTLTELSKFMDQDINGTLNGIDPSGNASALRDQANAAYGAHRDTFDPILERVYKNGDASLKQFEDPQHMFDAADTDPAIARKLRGAFRDQDLPVLKTGMLSTAFDKAYDPASKSLNVDALLSKITASDSPYKSVFTPTELANTEQVLRGLRTQNAGAMQTGKGLGFYGGRFALAAGGGAAGAMMGHDTGSRALGTIAGAGTALIAPSIFVNRVLLNPTNARIAAQLSKLPADSPTARMLTQTLLKGALKGVQIETATPTQEEGDSQQQ